MSESHEELRREALSIDEVGKVVGLGRTKLYQAIAVGQLKAKKIGRRTIVLRGDLAAFLESLPSI
ncbi:MULTISPECIES: helix-turn-helix domain-containing protein [Bradyrhizobium]|uniref:Helix-turn-helix domain-containing protein n=1 Tax=Bradyrhizobium septentrionale TaxID=1404411 RepID=A0ABZ2NZX4_9BRAD|nr:helix-turn-helix domain-containing protein [Bradyrhizobium sp. 2S1]MCK7667937.1 helix-turn-helix domain-containing protein [Bradyrhizobium sp. 2S1]